MGIKTKSNKIMAFIIAILAILKLLAGQQEIILKVAAATLNDMGENYITIVSSSTTVSQGESFEVTIGFDLLAETNVSAFDFTLVYDSNVLDLITEETRYPGNLTSVSTGSYFTLSAKGTVAQISGDIVIFKFKMLDASKSSSIGIDIDYIANSIDKEVKMDNPDPVFINSTSSTEKNSIIMTQSSTTVSQGESFEVTIGFDLLAETNVSAFDFTLVYDSSILALMAQETQYPGNLTSVSTGSYFTLSAKGTVAQISGDIVIFKFKVLEISNSTSIGIDIDYVANSVDKEVKMDNPDPVFINFSFPKIEVGDLTGDGKVTIADLIRLARHLANIDIITDAKVLQAANTDGIGNVDTADLVRLSRYIAEIDKSPMGPK